MRLVACLLALSLLPLATAGSVPTIGFLRDDGPPVSPGILSLDWPTGNESSARQVPPELLGETTFVADFDAPGEAWLGRLMMGVWPDAGIAKEAVIQARISIDDEVVAEASIPVDVDPEDIPDPQALVPPDPTDPQGAVMHAAVQAAPLILEPPLLVDFGIVDLQVPNGSVIKLHLSVQSGEVPVPGTAAIKYDSLLSPGFVYIPWFSADPEATAPQVAPAAPAPQPAPQPQPSGPAPSPTGEDSPLPFVAVLLALGIALRLRRN